ncbi:MAG: tRNA (adenosine(37)-N6)-threonylcarbamoyltransferase complex dimerization subunit type 1 TsaB [Rickettsiales bacterium]
MKILSFDTSNSLASAAILSDNKLLSHNSTKESSQQAEKLFSLIDESLKEAKLKIEEIDLISVTNGPGSFTGVRIGLAAALGLQIASKLRIIALTNFQVLAWQRYQENLKQPIEVLLNARRDQVYQQKFSKNLEIIAEPSLVNIDDLKLSDDALLIGDGIALLTKEDSSLDQYIVNVNAELLSKATEFYWQKKQYHDLIPLYIREPDFIKKI